MHRLLICDWDGTVADSVPQIISCKQALAKKYGLQPPTAELVRSVLGKEFKLAMQTCFPTLKGDLLIRLCEEFKTLMQTDNYVAEPFPGALSILRQLKNVGYKLAVSTSKSRAELDHAIQLLGIEDLFELTCCAEEYEPKPSPKMIDVICNTLMIPKHSSVMIGDAESDVLSAKNAGTKIICVTFGAQSYEQLVAYQPDAFIDDWQELPNLLIKLSTIKARL